MKKLLALLCVLSLLAVLALLGNCAASAPVGFPPPLTTREITTTTVVFTTAAPIAEPILVRVTQGSWGGRWVPSITLEEPIPPWQIARTEPPPPPLPQAQYWWQGLDAGDSALFVMDNWANDYAIITLKSFDDEGVTVRFRSTMWPAIDDRISRLDTSWEATIPFGEEFRLSTTTISSGWNFTFVFTQNFD